MANYLQQHPEIFIPDIKEPSFFGSDLTGLRVVNNLEEYNALFSPGATKLCGEGSTWYLYSLRAAKEIYDYNSNAKIIIMLRNPVDVMYSLHSQNLFNGNTEDILDFAEAVEAERDRKLGRRIPSSCDRVEALYYTDAVRFSNQVKRYFEQFGRNSVHIVIYNDFKRDPVNEVRNTFKFLGVEPTFTSDVQVVNGHKRHRIRILYQFLADTPHLIRQVGRMVPSGVRREIRDFLGKANIDRSPRPPMDSVLRRKLMSAFREEIDRLSCCLGRDLTDWYTSELGTNVAREIPKKDRNLSVQSKVMVRE